MILKCIVYSSFIPLPKLPKTIHNQLFWLKKKQSTFNWFCTSWTKIILTTSWDQGKRIRVWELKVNTADCQKHGKMRMTQSRLSLDWFRKWHEFDISKAKLVNYFIFNSPLQVGFKYHTKMCHEKVKTNRQTFDALWVVGSYYCSWKIIYYCFPGLKCLQSWVLNLWQPKFL